MGNDAGPHALQTELTPRTRWFLYLLVLAVAAGSGLASILSATMLYSPASWPENRPPNLPMFSANDRSRWCTVWSLAERGTYEIDEIIQVPGWDTIDKVRDRDHFYSSKPALLPTLVAGLYWVLKRTAGLDLLTRPHETMHVILLIINWLPLLISIGVYGKIAERYARTDWSRIFLVLTAAAGTFLTTFQVTFNNHSIAAAAVLFALYPALRIAIDGRREWYWFALAGFWSVFAACNELPAFAFAAALFLYLAWLAPGRTLLWFVPAALVPLAGFWITTWLSTGSWRPFYFDYGTEKYQYEFEGVPSYWLNPSDVDRGRDSPLAYLLHCTLGHHGIFSLSPVFLLTALSWALLKRWRDAALQTVCWLSLGLTVLVLGFYLTRTHNYNYGGNTSGLRWTFWLIPLWLVSTVPLLDAWGDRCWLRVASVVCLGMSVFSVQFPERNPWQAPWLQNMMQSWGWVDYRTPTEPFSKPLRSWFPSLPEPSAEDEQPWVELVGYSRLGEINRLRLQRVRREEIGREAVQLVRATTSSKGGLSGASVAGSAAAREETLELWIAELPFRAGDPPAKVVRPPAGSAAGSTTKSQLAAAQLFLQGLPLGIEYSAGPVRYLKTPLRRDAFRCRIAAAVLRFQPSRTATPLIYYRRMWLCEDIPFGVLQVDDQLIDPRDNSIVFKQRLTATSVSRIQASPAP